MASEVTGQRASGSSSAASVLATYPGTPTNGNKLICEVYTNVAPGNTTLTGWTLAIEVACGANANNGAVSLWWKDAGVGEATAITVNSTGSTVMRSYLREWNGLVAGAPEAVSSVNSGSTSVTTGPAASVGQLITTTANDVLMAAYGLTASSSGWSVDSSFTLGPATARLATADRIVAATGTYNPSLTWVTAGRVGGVIAAFKATTPATVAPPAAGSTLSMPVPAVTGAATIAPPAAGVTATMQVPTVAGAATIVVPVASATLSMLVPDVTAGATIAPPAAGLALSMPVPAITAGVTIEPPPAVVTLHAYAPAVTGDPPPPETVHGIGRSLRRNIIPNPIPVGTDGWNHFESNGHLITFEEVDGNLMYDAVADAAESQLGYGWNDATEITVRPHERYGMNFPVDVEDRPDVGYLRALVLFYELDGTPVSTWFGPDMPVGETQIEETIVCPDGAYRARLSILHLTTADMTPDLVTHVKFSSTKFLLEPLGPPPLPFPGAVTNEVLDPLVEYGGYQWNPHTPDANVVEVGTTFQPELRGSDHWMRMSITAGHDLIPDTTFYGFVGAYINNWYECVPGDIIRYQIDVIVHAGPPTGPGCFQEEFFYNFVGLPVPPLLHVNGDTIDDPLVLGVVQTQVMEAECPPGANICQVTSVLVSGTPDEFIDFSARRAIVTINDELVVPFSGDTAGAGWNGIPGKSTSNYPGADAPVPGEFFTGDDLGAQWEGVHHRSMSSYQPPIVRHTALIHPAPSVDDLRFITAASAPH